MEGIKRMIWFCAAPPPTQRSVVSTLLSRLRAEAVAGENWSSKIQSKTDKTRVSLVLSLPWHTQDCHPQNHNVPYLESVGRSQGFYFCSSSGVGPSDMTVFFFLPFVAGKEISLERV